MFRLLLLSVPLIAFETGIAQQSEPVSVNFYLPDAIFILFAAQADNVAHDGTAVSQATRAYLVVLSGCIGSI